MAGTRDRASTAYDAVGNTTAYPNFNLLGSDSTQTSRTIQYGYDIASHLTLVTTAAGTMTYTFNKRDPTRQHLLA